MLTHTHTHAQTDRWGKKQRTNTHGIYSIVNCKFHIQSRRIFNALRQHITLSLMQHSVQMSKINEQKPEQPVRNRGKYRSNSLEIRFVNCENGEHEFD